MDTAWSSLSARLRIPSHEGSIDILFYTNVSASRSFSTRYCCTCTTPQQERSYAEIQTCQDLQGRSLASWWQALPAHLKILHQRLTIPCSTQSYSDSKVRQILTPLLQSLTVLQLPIPYIHDIIASKDALQLECRARRLYQRT